MTQAAIVILKVKRDILINNLPVHEHSIQILRDQLKQEELNIEALQKELVEINAGLTVLEGCANIK